MVYVPSSPPLAILTGNSIQTYVYTNKNVSITQTKPMQRSIDNLFSLASEERHMHGDHNGPKL